VTSTDSSFSFRSQVGKVLGCPLQNWHSSRLSHDAGRLQDFCANRSLILHCCATVLGEQSWTRLLRWRNRTPAPKHAPHQSTLKRVPSTTIKCAIYTPNRFVLIRQWPQFKEGTLYTLVMLRITTSAAILPCYNALEVSLS
jgi:hypothetical protein